MAGDLRADSTGAWPAPASASTETAVARGKPTPPSGDSLPPPREVSRGPLHLANAVEQLAEFAARHARALDFRLDEVSGRTVVTVSNAATGEVIRQIPSAEVLAIAAALSEQSAAALLSEHA